MSEPSVEVINKILKARGLIARQIEILRKDYDPNNKDMEDALKNLMKALNALDLIL